MVKKISLNLLWAAAVIGSLALGVPGCALAQVAGVPMATAILPATPNATVERIASMLERRYVMPAIGARYAAMLRSNIKAKRYVDIVSSAQLGAQVTADLQALAKDGHLRVRLPRRHTPTHGAASSTSTSSLTEIAPGIRDARWAAPGVAYLSFSYFSDDPASIQALTTFLRDHRNAKALIIDARQHRGGSFPMLAILGDHLNAKSQNLANLDVSKADIDENGSPFPECPELRRVKAAPGLVRFEHWSIPTENNGTLPEAPVYILTSHRTFSAGEHLAMMLRSSHRAQLIGETTGGGNHFGGVEEVGMGLEMFVPIGRTTDPQTGDDWEGRGIAPDVAVPADEALNAAMKIIALAKA